MTKITKLLSQLEKRVSALESQLTSQPPSSIACEDEITYREVIEEWLNGKKQS